VNIIKLDFSYLSIVASLTWPEDMSIMGGIIWYRGSPDKLGNRLMHFLLVNLKTRCNFSPALPHNLMQSAKLCSNNTRLISGFWNIRVQYAYNRILPATYYNKLIPIIGTVYDTDIIALVKRIASPYTKRFSQNQGLVISDRVKCEIKLHLEWYIKVKFEAFKNNNWYLTVGCGCLTKTSNAVLIP
jgi:hypothetical protein